MSFLFLFYISPRLWIIWILASEGLSGKYSTFSPKMYWPHLGLLVFLIRIITFTGVNSKLPTRMLLK